MNTTANRNRARCRWTLLALLLALAAADARWPAPLWAEDPLRTPFSELATRELRKQLKDKRIPFHHATLSGHVAAIEPETRLTVDVQEFKLAGDVLSARLRGAGRFKIDGQVQPTAEGQEPALKPAPGAARADAPRELGILADVELTIVIEARFVKDGTRYFVEPKVQNLDAKLTFLEFTPANLSGSEEMLSVLARAAFARYKDQIIAEANGRLGRQPF